MNSLDKEVMQASAIVGSMNSAESCLARPSAQNPRVAKCKSQNVGGDISKKSPTSVRPIDSEPLSEAEVIQRATCSFPATCKRHSLGIPSMCMVISRMMS
jgi:hypothetical protein